MRLDRLEFLTAFQRKVLNLIIIQVFRQDDMIHRHHFLRFLACFIDIAFIFQLNFCLRGRGGIEIKVQRRF